MGDLFVVTKAVSSIGRAQFLRMQERKPRSVGKLSDRKGASLFLSVGLVSNSLTHLQHLALCLAHKSIQQGVLLNKQMDK